MTPILILLGVVGNLWTEQAADLLRGAGLDFCQEPIGEGTHPANSNPAKRAIPTLVRYWPFGKERTVLASGIDQIKAWVESRHRKE